MKINSEYFSIILMINIIFILALAFSEENLVAQYLQKVIPN